MSLTEVVAKLSVKSAFSFKRPPHRSMLQQESARLANRVQRVGAARNEFDRDAMVFRLRQVSERGAWHLLSKEDLRRSVLVLSDGQPPLQEDKRVLNGLLSEILKREGSVLFRSLIGHYLRNFETESLSTTAVAGLLEREVRSRGGLEKWRKRHVAHGLFDNRRVATTLANMVLSGGDAETVFLGAGIRGDAIVSGIGRCSFKVGCRIVQERLSRREEVELADTLIRWAKPPEGDFRYPRERAILAEALLLPWVDHDPSDEELKSNIESFLDEVYGDPRFDLSRWSGVSEPALSVRFKWLAGQALKLFLNIVGEATDRPDQWQYRRAFWEAYMNRGYVPHAWVAFGRDGRSLVNRMIRESDEVDESAKGSCAILESALPSHAVLLMRIADLVIADWSHNGTLRIWRKDHINAPKMYKSSYNGDELRSTCRKSFRHWPVEGINCWQNQAHDYIRDWTRIEIPKYEYMP